MQARSLVDFTHVLLEPERVPLYEVVAVMKTHSGRDAIFCFGPAAASADWRWRTCWNRRDCSAADCRRRRACDATPSGQSVRAEAAALQAAREGRDLAVHERRRQPGGHVRSQAGARRSTRASRSTGKGDVVVRQGHPGPLMPSPFTFKKYGQSGMDVSELFPHIGAARRRDRVRCGRSTGKSNDHVQATTSCRPARSGWDSRASARG